MSTLNDNFSLRDQGASNALLLDTLPRHRWYFVKEGFSPKIVEEAITSDGVRRGEVLFDPFSGSGTVPLTGAINGLQSSAFEVNPFLRFLSATKLIQSSPKTFRSESEKIMLKIKQQVHSPLEGYSTFTEGNRWGRWLFPLPVLRSFEAGRQAVIRVSADHRDLLQLALLGAAMDCCNATRDGKCLRYSKDWSSCEATAAQFRERFRTRVKAITEDLTSAPLDKTTASITEGDSRRLIAAPSKEKFRLCITSPPYLNSFDYSDVYRPELFLGGFVNSNESLMNVRLKTVRSHIQASWEHPRKDQFGATYHNCITNIQECADGLWNPRIPEMIQAYFEDMEIILRGLRQRAETNASLWLVVSTSASAGIEVPVDLILADIGQRSGWFLREVGVLRYLRSSSQHFKHIKEDARKSIPLRESVVIFDASKKRSVRRINKTRNSSES
jgi:hypothetical protein